MKKYVPDKEHRRKIIERGIEMEKPIFDDGQLGKVARYVKPDKNYYDVVLHGITNCVEFFWETLTLKF